MGGKDELGACVRAWCEKRGLPAAQYAVARDGELLAFGAEGQASTETRFVIWSCTKAIVASVIWQLVGEGTVGYDAPVAVYIEEFETNGKQTVTVDHVLLHTAGFPLAPMGPQRWSTSATRKEQFARWRLNWEPGSRYEYHQLAAGWVLAEIIEVVEGRDYRDAVHARVRDPLGLVTFALGVAEKDQAGIAPIEVVGESAVDADYVAAGWTALPPPDLTPHAALVMNTPAALSVGIPGGGAVATAADVALFYQALLHNPGELWRSEVLADASSIVRNQFPDLSRWGEPANRTRGLVLRGTDEPYASLRHHFGPATSARTFGHDGAGGQIAWADPASGLSFCFLTSGYDANRVQELLRNQDLSRLAAAYA